MELILSWAILTVAVLVAAAIVPGMQVKGVGGAVLTAAIFGIVNFLIGWILFLLIGIGTLGLGFLLAFLTRWLVDAIVLKITDAFTTKLTVRGFGSAFVAALIMALVGTLGEYLLRGVGAG